MPFRHFPLPDLIEGWLRAKAPNMQKRRSSESKLARRLPITWRFAASSSKSPLRRKLSGHLARRKRRSGTFCNRDGQDEPRTMSESARIAFAYRASQNSAGVVSNFDIPLWTGTYVALGSDDSQVSNPTNVESSSSVSLTSEVQNKPSGLSDMLSRLAPIIIEKDDEAVLDRERCRLALRHHRSICTNVVVESQYPDSAPHIVITPPPEQDVLEAPDIAQSNQIPLQYYPSLLVPSICRMTTFEPWRPLFCSSFGGSVNQGPPANRLVFNRPNFSQWVKHTEEHRRCLFRKLIIPAVTRHLLKASAMTASILAPSFRARYDSPGFLESLENPFRWTDPALALLSLFRGHPVGVHHIPSPEPFSVPHILIEESFGNDQTTVDENVAPVQNFSDSNTLIVPAYTNPSCLRDILEIEEPSLDYDSSTCQSSPPKTPTELGKVDYGFLACREIGTPLRDDLFPEIQSHQTTGLSHRYRDSKALFFIEEEEEDEFI